MGFFDKLFGPKRRDPAVLADLGELAGQTLTAMLDRLFDNAGAGPLTLEVNLAKERVPGEPVANAAAALGWLGRNPNYAARLSAGWTAWDEGEHWVVVKAQDADGGASVELRCSYHPAVGATPLMMGNRLLQTASFGDEETAYAVKEIVLGAIALGRRNSKWTVRESESERAWKELVASAVPLLQALSVRLPPADPAGRFDFSQDTGKFTMRDASGAITVEARFVPVGTWSSNSNSWFWGWANESFDRALVEPLQKLRAYGGMRELETLSAPRVPCSMEEAEQIYAVALQVLEAHGWYRAQISPTSWIHTALFDIQLAPGVKAPVN